MKAARKRSLGYTHRKRYKVRNERTRTKKKFTYERSKTSRKIEGSKRKNERKKRGRGRNDRLTQQQQVLAYMWVYWRKNEGKKKEGSVHCSDNLKGRYVVLHQG